MINYILKYKRKQYIFPIFCIICIIFNPSFTYASDSSKININNNIDVINSEEEPKPYTVYLTEIMIGNSTKYNKLIGDLTLAIAHTVTRTSINVELQKKTSTGYTTIVNWNDTTTEFTYSKVFSYVPSTYGHTYRFKVEITLYDSSGNIEYDVEYSPTIIY